MDAETERQAEARKVLAMYGADAPVFVAARIGALVWADDQSGIDRWRQIAARLDRLMVDPGPHGVVP
ncbi:hypothetical protein [Sphingomonas immobilis]|uniref:Uncharacterized protein n=1 Tax=Sphingomonas immobilis TaxID=3063997 RepID=A0ABT9A182_9SPHN|nr:hypothetical protein [Sphingomonas sp. CA1-15]MDO7843565.1 hypothetical protein [Sphingomonas sp. CA1-15]